MQSRTKMSHHNSHLMHRKNLPRGYFKKRKHESEDARPPDIAKTMQQQQSTFSLNYLNSVNMKTFKFLIVLILWMASGNPMVQQCNATTTIEPDLKVLSLERSVTPTPLLTNENGSGICSSIDIRFDLPTLEKLRGCRVVEGSISILLMDELKIEDFSNYTFPELVEITGYLMLYRISGIKSLYDVFPNLAVIRGRDIFKDYSLIIYEIFDLEEIGLINLQTIERGNVRIEKNDQLCFADKIDWSLIAGTGEHYIAKNKMSAHCPICSKDSQHCLRSKNDPRSSLCWNQKHCQIKCNCNGSACTKSGKCCDPSCVGGCDEDNPKKCKACKKFIVGEGENAECREKCPDDTYEYLQRRCVTKRQCYDLNVFANKDSQNSLPFKNSPTYIPFNRSCMLGCPQSFVDFKNDNETDCRPCGSECQKKCQAKIIDSIAAAQTLKGCAIIEGPLEIQIRSSAKTVDSTNNVVKELENSLSEIIEIHDYLKIARSFPIVSLSFLKKLKYIRGKRLESNKYALVIWDNQNLQELWDENQEVQIDNGQLFFHFNPKLCFFKIERLTKSPARIENYDTAKISNGDKIPCNVTSLAVNVANILSHAALLTWDPLKLEDERSLLSYVVFYIPAQYTNVTLWDGRDACGNDGWLVDDVNDFTTYDPIAFPLTKLEPYTQYAYYVKAYTLATERTGAQSDIQYFRTLPGQPQAITKFKSSPKSSSSVELSWEPPKKVNGKLSHYILRLKMIEKNEQLLNQRDYCIQPFEQTDSAVKQETKTQEPAKSSLLSTGQCDCESCVQTCQKLQPDGDEQRQSAIDFEDEIQDFVYVKNDQLEPKEVRAKRQAEFPYEMTDKETTKKKEPDTEPIMNAQGEYIYFHKEINDSSQTSIELVKLKHYTSYQIFLKACREKSEQNATLVKPGSFDEQCGPDTQISTLTLKREDSDLITVFDATSIQSNGSLGSIRVTWKAPENPNGMLLTYTIRYKKNDIEHTKWDLSCISHKLFLNQSSHILRSLSNGNYSIQIAATSMAGMGNYTSLRYVVISDNNGSGLMTIFTALFFVFLGLVAILIYVCRRYRLTYISNMKLIANVNADYVGVLYKQDGWEVPRDKVLQLQELGQGSFGMVYEGIIKDLKLEGGETRCAIKTVNENATDKERVSFLNEASVMKQFDTAFVVRLLGVVSQTQPTYVVMELMTNGDLKTYLRSHRPEYDNGTEPPPQPPTLRQILQMSAEIADGMSYLSAKKFVHRDLAARNCMVGEDLTVKIGDFGMTRDIYETDYYRKGTKGLLPVRWMSPESLKDGVFTSSSDVFSYGVVLWEMATLASQPYQGLSNDQVLRYVIEGGVMERPENCPDKLYELMRRCWQHRPSARPTFMDIIEMLLDDVNQNFRNIAFYFTKDGQDALNQQRQSDYAVNITDDVTTPLRQDEEETSSIENNHFLMGEMNSDHKLHEL